MDYVKIAREIVYHMESERGTGRTYILQNGLKGYCNSTDHKTECS